MVGKCEKLLAISLLVCLILNGCGKPTDDTATISNTTPPSEQATSTPITESENNGGEYDTNDMVRETLEINEIKEQDIEITSTTAEPTTENTPASGIGMDDMEGLVALIVSPRQQSEDNDSYYDIYSIQNINLNTGEVREISHFCVVSFFGGIYDNLKGSESGIFARPDVNGDELSQRTMFSPDYDKMAVSQYMVKSGVYNTGWIDQYGNFTDVAARTGNASTDFNIRSFKTLGFMPDGTFTYREQNTDAYNILYPVFSTNSETLSAAIEEDPWPKFYMCNQNYIRMGSEGQDETIFWFERNYVLTDWINDAECIADTGIHTGSVIVNTQTQEVTKYIPDTNIARVNWSGVSSPDDNEIAFLSMTANGTDGPCIYIISRGGGEPVKVSCDVNFNRNYAIYYRLLEWK